MEHENKETQIMKKRQRKKTMENEKTRMENEEVEKWKKIGVKKMRMRSNGK